MPKRRNYSAEFKREAVALVNQPGVTRAQIGREILAEFADYGYEGDPVLRSGGDSELFTHDVLKLDSQDDFLAMLRRNKKALS